MSDFIQDLSDDGLVNFANNMWTVVSNAPGDFAATADQATDLKTKNNAFSAELTTHISAQSTAKAQTKVKNTSRNEDENIVRFIYKQAKLNGVSDAKITEMGFPAGYYGDIATNATRPVIIIKTGEHLRHIAEFADEADPGSKRRPRLVKWFELFRKKGGATSVELKEFEFIASDTEPPYMVEYDGADAGMMIHYIGRWRFKDDSVSPTSETVSATVPG